MCIYIYIYTCLSRGVPALEKRAHVPYYVGAENNLQSQDRSKPLASTPLDTSDDSR